MRSRIKIAITDSLDHFIPLKIRQLTDKKMQQKQPQNRQFISNYFEIRNPFESKYVF